MVFQLSSSPRPLQTALIEGETAFSYMSRMAAIGSVSAADFGRDIGIPFQRVVEGNPNALQGLADLGGVSWQALSSWSPSKAPGKQRLLRGERFPAIRILGPSVTGCPHCLREDMEGGARSPQRKMAIRGGWLVPQASLCLKHHHPLVPLWSETALFRRYDTVTRFAEVADQVASGAFDRETREPTDFDEWLEGRLREGDQGTWLDQHPLNAASNFCRLLGTALLKREGVAITSVARSAYWALYQMGFEVARHGEQAVREALQSLNMLAEPREGPKAAFGQLYDRLSREYLDNPDYAPFRKILADHLVETWPLGEGDVVMDIRLPQRRLHSLKTASAETGIDARRLRKALREEGLIGDGKPDGWETFDAAAARPVLDGLTTFVSAKAYAAQLNIPRSQFDLLVADGVLAPSLKEGDTYMAWDPRAGAEFLQSLLAGAETLSHAQHGWETIAKCAQRLKLRPAEIVRAIQAGQIHRVGNNIHFQGYQAIHVVHDDVAQVLGAGPAEEMTLDRFAKSIGIGRPVHLTRLVKHGHTPATRLRNPKTRAMQYYITQADADAFHEKFVTLRTLAKARKLSWQRASALLRLHKVEPFSADGMDFGNTFLKAEVEKALG